MMEDFKDGTGISLRKVVNAPQLGTQISELAAGGYHAGVSWRGHSQKLNHEMSLVSALNLRNGSISLF